MAGSRQGGANVFDDEATLRPARERLGVRNRGDSGHHAVESPVGEGGRRERLPACNRSLDGRERASEQQGGGKDDGGTSALFEDEPGGTAHDQNLRQRASGFGDQHDDLIAALYQFVLASRVLRGLVDKARGAVEHSHSPDHVDVSDSHAEPSLAPRQRCNGASQRPFSEEVTCKSEAEQEKSDDCADRPQQWMHEEKNGEEDRRPEHVEQHRACSGLSELTQGRKIAIRLRCARLTDLIRIVQASRGHCRMESIFKPLAHPGHCSAAQRVKHSANHDGERNDEGQHQERIGAAARQDAIVDLKQIDGGSEKKEIVTAAICENESDRPRAGPQGRFQRRPRR